MFLACVRATRAHIAGASSAGSRAGALLVCALLLLVLQLPALLEPKVRGAALSRAEVAGAAQARGSCTLFFFVAQLLSPLPLKPRRVSALLPPLRPIAAAACCLRSRLPAAPPWPSSRLIAFALKWKCLCGVRRYTCSQPTPTQEKL